MTTLLPCRGDSFLQSTLYSSDSFRSIPQPSFDNRFEQVIRPLDIQHTEDRMCDDENHFPMPISIRSLDAIGGHEQKDDKHVGIYIATYPDPCCIKHGRYELLNQGWNGRRGLEDDSAGNQEKRVDFDRQNGTDKALIFRPKKGTHKVKHGGNVMLYARSVAEEKK